MVTTFSIPPQSTVSFPSKGLDAAGKKAGTRRKGTMSVREELQNRKDWQEELYTRYHRKVLGICAYFLKDREEARDASHDVFMKAFKGWEDFEWKCDPLTWMGTIAKHECFSRIQKRKRQWERQEEVAYAEAERHLPEPEEELVLHKLRLEKALPEVHGKLREILRLNLEQGLNHREIAVRMGVSRVAITRRLTRFKRAMLAAQPLTGLTLAKARRESRPTLMVTARSESSLGRKAA